jgi:sRNA-binding protein
MTNSWDAPSQARPAFQSDGSPAAKPTPASLAATLAGHFPAVLVVDPWRPHRPLKVGIKADLVATGVMDEREIQSALRHYCRRRFYLQAVADGGERYDLDGNPTGEVSREDREWAANQVAAIDVAKAKAKAKANAKAAKAAAKANAKATANANAEAALAAQSKTQAATLPRKAQFATVRRAAGKAVQGRKAAPVSGKAPPERTQVRLSSAGDGRLSLADLRAAALARRAAQA